MVKQLCSHILIPLCPAGTVTVEKRALDLVSSTPGIKLDSLGIGTLSTWHGTPDLRVRGVEVIVRKPLEELDDEDCEVVEEWDSDEEGSDPR